MRAASAPLLLALAAPLGCRDQPAPQPHSNARPPDSHGPATLPSSPALADPKMLEPIGRIVRSPLAPPPPVECPPTPDLPRVVARDGNLILCTADGASAALTTSGEDHSPSMSPGRDAVVFLRRFGMADVSLRGADRTSIHDNRVYVIRLQGRSAVEVARNNEQAGCLSLWNPTYLDATTVLVEARGFEASTIHNLSACVVDLPAKRLAVIARRTSCAMLITAGRFKGKLFVAPWDFEVGQGMWSWYGVVDRRGRRLHAFDEHPLRQDWNGDGNIMDEEMAPECMDLSAHRSDVEQLMRRW